VRIEECRSLPSFSVTLPDLAYLAFVSSEHPAPFSLALPGLRSLKFDFVSILDCSKDGFFSFLKRAPGIQSFKVEFYDDEEHDIRFKLILDAMPALTSL
jgi:hypothetical protein